MPDMERGSPPVTPSQPKQEEEAGKAMDLGPLGGSFANNHDDEDYEERFMKDARQRAHDAELAALANLAIIRSNNTDRDRLLMNLELDQALNPREVDRRLRSGEDDRPERKK